MGSLCYSFKCSVKTKKLFIKITPCSLESDVSFMPCLVKSQDPTNLMFLSCEKKEIGLADVQISPLNNLLCVCLVHCARYWG